MTIICVFTPIPSGNLASDDSTSNIQVEFWQLNDRTGYHKEIGEARIFAQLNFQDAIADYQSFRQRYHEGTFENHFGGDIDINSINGGSFQLDHWISSTDNLVRKMKTSLNAAFGSDSWRNVREAILGQSKYNEPLRIVLRTQEVNLQSFPVELSSFIQTNLLQYFRSVSTTISHGNQYQEINWTEQQPRILIILGSQENISQPFDRAEIEGYFPNAIFEALPEPSREE